MKMKCTRMYADSEGESHFEDVEIELHETDFAPPAQPFYVSPPSPATGYSLVIGPVGWYGDWHPTPRRFIAFFFAGQDEMTVSDGEVRTFGPGDIVLQEDTTGKGHYSRNAGSTEMTAAMVQLPE